MAQQTYILNIKNADGEAVSPVLAFLQPNGDPITVNGQAVTLSTVNGFVTFTNEQSNIKLKPTLAGYASTPFTVYPGSNTVTIQKAGSVAAVADTAKSNWWKIVLVIVLIILAVWAYKKYWKKG